MAKRTNSHGETIDRRRFLQFAGASGAVALAGCADLVQPGNGDGNGGTGGRHVSNTNTIPKDIQWNTSNPSNRAQISNRLLFDPFVRYNFAKSEFTPHAISDWNHGGKTFELTVRDGLKWSNGDPVTSADVATQLRIGMKTGETYADYTEAIETPDEKTVKIQFASKINQKIAEFQILSERDLHQKESKFGKFLDEIEKDEDAGLKKLQEFSYQEPIASGPFEYKRADQQQLVLTLRDDHPDAKNINFDEYVFKYHDGNQSTHQALKNGAIDSVFTVYTPTETVKSFPEEVKQVQTPSNWGYGLVPNHDHRHLGDRAVRQAIQYVINRKQIVNNVSPDSKQVPEYPMGIASESQKEWLSDAIGDFESYGADSSQTDKAAQVLKDAGYTKQEGTWTDSDGKTVELPILEPSGWTDWNTATQSIVDQLNSFGFKARSEDRDFGTLSGNIWPNGDFALSAGGWLAGAPQGAYPYFSLHHQLIKNFRGFTYNYAAADKTRGGKRADVTVPARSGSGSTTINPAKRLSELAAGADEATIKKITTELAWVTNQDLPMIPVMEKVEQTFLTDGDEWKIPKPDADVAQVRWANTWLPRVGKMEYTGK